MRSAYRLLLLPGLMFACSSPTAPRLTGQWGGAEASLVIAQGGGVLQYLCGSGTMDSAWVLSRDGLLTGTGEHFIGGGPIPEEGRPPHPAVYSGHVEGNVLTLVVTITDLGETLGPYRLVRGGAEVQEICQ